MTGFTSFSHKIDDRDRGGDAGEQGKISWTTTIGESFPELGDKLHPDYRGVTLEQLLAHRGGVPGEAPRDLWSKAWFASGTPAEQRLDFVKGILARTPEAKPGTNTSIPIKATRSPE